MRNVKTTIYILLITISYLSCNSNSTLTPENYRLENDVEMDKAIETAKKTLDSFDYAYKNYKGVFIFALKKRFVENGNVEDVWITPIKLENGNYVGEMGETNKIKNVKVGEKVQIDRQDIIDWMYIINSKLYGGHTTEIELKRLYKKSQGNFKKNSKNGL